MKIGVAGIFLLVGCTSAVRGPDPQAPADADVIPDARAVSDASPGSDQDARGADPPWPCPPCPPAGNVPPHHVTSRDPFPGSH
jgi:hypothetical protein